jgi:predicted oxidoreductase
MNRIDLLPGLSFSRLVYGMWRLGDDADKSPKHVQAKIEACLAQGITTLDQADIYGGYTAEAILGAALKAAPQLRDKVEIVTKCDIVAPAGRHAQRRVKHYDTSEAHIRASVEASLREMAIERIDLLLIHRPDPLMDHVETGRALDALIAEGKIRAAGVSNFRPWDTSLLQSAMRNRLATNQIEVSLLAHEPFTNGDIASMQEKFMAPMAWSPLGGGRIYAPEHAKLREALAKIGAQAGIDEAAVAVAWLLRHPSRLIPVLGTNNLARIAKIGEALKLDMDRETWFELYTLALGRPVA